jgi:hypothetical protein
VNFYWGAICLREGPAILRLFHKERLQIRFNALSWQTTSFLLNRPYQALKTILVFEVLTAVAMKSSIFWDVTPCSPLKVNRRFGRTCRLYFNGRRIRPARNKREVKRKETSTDFQRTTRPDRNLPTYCFVGCDATWSGRRLPMHRRNMLPPYWLEDRGSKQLRGYMASHPRKSTLQSHRSESLKSHFTNPSFSATTKLRPTGCLLH